MGHSAVMGWDVCVMVSVDSWDNDKGEKRVGGGGEHQGPVPARHC
jgi:hypothetical protein